MSIQLLDQTRKINRLLRNAESTRVDFNDICGELCKLLTSNMLVISKKGKVLGVGRVDSVAPLAEQLCHTVGGWMTPAMNERFLNVLSTNENVNLAAFGFGGTVASGYHGILLPIEIAGVRYGTVFLYRDGVAYDIDEIILCEYSTTVVGLELMRSVAEEDAAELHKRQLAQSAIATLTVTEREAICHVLDELGGSEGILVASKVAEHHGITRSVIVNAIRKFESAGLMISHSSGMKGTYIKITNDAVLEELSH